MGGAAGSNRRALHHQYAMAGIHHCYVALFAAVGKARVAATECRFAIGGTSMHSRDWLGCFGCVTRALACSQVMTP